ncbi:hypothetical protein [Fischerella thermalis]|uniref:hypothetical protein n=1 Tax=Fischerella thermalis TaxID=372787 RepID=UPI0012F95753|nr:hypothetical protein [Fischerella thermalis]
MEIRRDVAVQRLYKICNVSTKFATSLQNLQRLYKICNVSTKFATSLQNRWGSHENIEIGCALYLYSFADKINRTGVTLVRVSFSKNICEAKITLTKRANTISQNF